MNKILNISLGVLAYINSVSCFATEKFEILPDLPDPLAYAVQPAVASTISTKDSGALLSTSSVGAEPNILSVIISLAIVVLLIYITGILYTKLNRVGFNTLKRQQGELSKSQVAVISTTQLGNNKTLHVVELDGKRMLIGASSSAIQLIKDLGNIEMNEDDCDYSRIEIPNIKIPKIEIPKIEIPAINFSKLATKAHKCLKDIEVVDEASKKKTEENVILEQTAPEKEIENPEVIIDSLFNQQAEHVEDNTASEHVVDPDDFALYKKYLG